MKKKPDIIKEFKEFQQDAKSKWGQIYTFCQSRKKFALKKDGQWSSEDKKRMGDTNPHMTFNAILGYINMIANEQIQQDIGCDVEPRSSGASEELALVRRAQVLALQDMCNAYSEYGFMLREELAAGIGGLRLVIKYRNGSKTDKTVSWEAIKDFSKVLFSANATGPGLCYKTRASIEEEMNKAEFEQKYGRYLTVTKDVALWETGNKKKVYEYWRLVEDESVEYEGADGKPVKADEYEEMDEASRPVLKMDEEGNRFESSTSVYKVEQYILGDNKILAGPDLFPANSIPIWLSFGRTLELDGEMEVQGIGTFAEDAQRAKNFLKCVKAQMWAKSPIPIAFVPAEGMNAVQEAGLMQAAKSGAGEYGVALIRYKSIDEKGNQIPPPRLEQPQLTDLALVQEEELLRKDIEAAIGVNNTPFLQNPEGASGVAIKESSMLGSTSNFDYVKSWQNTIQESLRCVLEIIERMPIAMQIKLAGEDEQERVAWVNSQRALPPGVMNYTLDPDEEYSLSLKVRPNSRTMREQENREILDYLKIDPSAAVLMGDLFMGNMSFNDAKKAQKRLLSRVPPQALTDGNPQLQAMQQQLQQAQGMMQQMQTQATQQLQTMKAQLDAAKAQLQSEKANKMGEIEKTALESKVKLLEVQVKQYDAETKRMQAETQRLTAMIAGNSPPTPAPGEALP